MKKKGPTRTYKGKTVLVAPRDAVPTKRTPDEWDIRDARSTLEKAERIKADKVMMKHVEAAHKREADTLAKVKGVKK